MAPKGALKKIGKRAAALVEQGASETKTVPSNETRWLSYPQKTLTRRSAPRQAARLKDGEIAVSLAGSLLAMMSSNSLSGTPVRPSCGTGRPPGSVYLISCTKPPGSRCRLSG